MAILTRILLTLAAFVVVHTSSAQTSHQPLTEFERDSLKKEVATILTTDQRYRWMILFGEIDEKKVQAYRKLEQNLQVERMMEVQHNHAGISTAAKDSLWTLQQQLDTMNLLKLAGIIAAHGFPGDYIRTEDLSIILMHSPRLPVINDVLSMLLEEVKLQHMPAMEYALLYDKVQLARKLPQLYFAAGQAQNGMTSGLANPTDLDATNRARKELGLPVLETK